MDVSEVDAKIAEQQVVFETEEVKKEISSFFQEEIERTISEIQKARGIEYSTFDKCDKLTFGLVADTHYMVNGTWEDTALHIKAVHKGVSFDEIIHLGDVTDGCTCAEVTKDYVNLVLDDLHSLEIPVRVVIGNHDSNYFKKNPDKFTIEEQIELYLRQNDVSKKPYYYVDHKEANLRCLFLTSFDDREPIRYGFSKEELQWVRSALDSMVNGGKVMVFCHDAPLAKLDYWSFLIRNGGELLSILEEYNRKDEYHILGYFYGHTHADAVSYQYSFPLVSIACAKCESFLEKKPKGVSVPKRELGTVSQDLWDTMVLNLKENRMDLIRFGAGENRVIDCSKRKKNQDKVSATKKTAKKIKVWAHRGASAHAPENTIPAFRLAVELLSDGVELDVQLTKDHEMVVIHDETINRVSDGTGFVCDYTLEELQKFNVNKHFPEYGIVQIPTLREVYQCLKDTGLSINLELKNSIFFYPQLEEKVLALAEEMGMADRILYSSFNHYSMMRIKQLQPNANIAFLFTDGFLNIPDYAKEHGAAALHPSIANLQYPDFIEDCKKNGIKLHVWTVNEMADIEHVVAKEVDAIITNWPERVREYLDEFTVEWRM